MSEIVSKSEMVARLAKRKELDGLSQAQIKAVFDGFTDELRKAVKKGHKVRMSGLGSFELRKRAARMGRNPKTGEALKIKASKSVAFTVAAPLKSAL